MSEPTGIFIVIEGTDGSGKSTQYALLKERLENEGHEVAAIHFPRYDEPSSYFVREYLQGNYGTAEEVGPYTASLFYALDRYQASFEIRQRLEEGKIVLCDRFVAANMAHQGTKFSNTEQRRGYFIWLDNIEFEMLGLPRPNATFVLNTPFEVIKQRLQAKERSSANIKKDVHEADHSHIEKSLEVYRDLCQLFPKDFTRIDCAIGDEVLSIEAISNLIWQEVMPMLPKRTKSKKAAIKTAAATSAEPATTTKPAPKATENPYIEKTEQGVRMTTAGREFLEAAVTNTDKNVYAFTEKLSPVTIAAAMARLSRRSGDMRLTILDEFAHTVGQDEKLLQRVITAFGDDSVQQLVGQHIVVERASNLLTKKLEWGRLASYLEQSTRYIYFDEKDERGRYRFHIPEHLDAKTKEAYIRTLHEIFDIYSHMVHQLTTYIRDTSSTPAEERDVAWRSATKAQACDAVRPVLPVATEATVGIYASGQALESLIMHLLADDLPEARQTGQLMLEEARKVIPTFLERADKPDRGGARIAYTANTRTAVKALAEQYLPTNHASEATAVTLTRVWPRNELDLVADMLYEHSDQPLASIKQVVDTWSYDKKTEVFEAYMGERLNRRHRPGRALETAHYSWDLVCDYGIFRDLQRHRMVDDLEWQLLSPRYGYDTPKLIEDAGLTDDFERCFQLSLELYSNLQAAGYTLEAQYATLLGHRMRWKVTYNARQAFHLHELRTTPQGHPGYRKLVREMHEKLASVHPLLAEAMKFVNQDEDPELTRLAAERYTQYKLKQLD